MPTNSNLLAILRSDKYRNCGVHGVLLEQKTGRIRLQVDPGFQHEFEKIMADLISDIGGTVVIDYLLCPTALTCR